MYSTANLRTMPSGPMQHYEAHSSGQMPNPHTRGQYPANPPHTQVQPQGGNMVLNRPPSPAPGAKPPCLHCDRIRQEKLWRQVQASPLPVSQQHSRHLPRPPVPAQPGQEPGPMPRSTPADGQPVPVQIQYHHQHQHQHQHQNQHHPAARFLTPVVTSTRAARPSLAGPAQALLHDIAQTVRAVFPYAQVADRHGMGAAKVAEVVSDTVITPLMRRADRPPGVG
jgi:hypothetical protein